MAVSYRKLGTLRLEERLATTGLGTLYRAVDEASGEAAIVKVLHSYFADDPDLIRRFFAALDAVQSLPPHPSLLQPRAWGQEGDAVWIASDPSAGPSVDRLDLPLAAAASSTIVEGVAAVLEHALAHGVTHRDLKPGNVFYDADTGRVQVGDFGMAVLGDGAPPLVKSSLLTPHPAFTAPECLDGQDASASSETFSLAVLAYWLRTGVLPYPARTRAMMRGLVQSGRLAAPTDPGAALPPQVADVLHATLTAPPYERPSGPAAFATELRAAEREAAETPVALPAAVPEPEAIAAVPPEDSAVYWTSTVNREAWFTGKRYRLGWRGWMLRLGAVAAIVALLVAGYAYSQRPPDVSPPSSMMASSVSPQSWELARDDLRNTAYVPTATAGIAGQLRWRFQTGEQFRTAPASDGEAVYIATGDNRIVSLTAETGAVRWETRTTGPVDYTPVIAGDLVFVGLRDWRLLALERATGVIRWQQSLGNPVSSPGAVTGGILYQPSTDGRLYAIDAATGALLWTFFSGSPIAGTPAVLDDLVIALGDNGWLHVLDRANGVKLFDFLIVGNANTTPVVTDETAYATFGSFGRRTSRLVAADIRERLVPLEREFYFVRGVLWIWGIGDVPPPPRGSRWSASLPGFNATSPALANGRLYVGSARKLVALDQTTGKLEWEFEAASPVLASPIVSDDTVYFGAEDGTLYALDLTGQPRWTFKTDGALRTHVVHASGRLFVTSADGALYALW